MTSSPPPVLEEVAPGWEATLAYQLLAEVTTWRLVHPDGRVRFAKVDSAGCYPTLAGEAERMVWAVAYLPVPRVVELTERDGTTVLITEALTGRDGTDPSWRDDPERLVRALGQGLAEFHRAVGEEWCPFRFDLEQALEHVARRVAREEPDPRGFHDEHRHLTPAAALAELRHRAPDTEDLVVTHGDYCPPNALLHERRVTGYVDLGQLGVADRWRDIAVGGWSTVWNFGAQYEHLFYEGYGVTPDPERNRFYRLLWELVS